MDKNKSIIIVLIVIIAILSCLIIASTLIQQHDNVITLEGISFNTTNATDFQENVTFREESSSEYGTTVGYRSENGTGDSYVVIIEYNKIADYDNELDEAIGDVILESFKDMPYQTVNGVVVYSGSKVSGVDVGKPVHVAYVQNSDLNKIVLFASSDLNETAKMALSLKFN